jgi:hypothetical protein
MKPLDRKRLVKTDLVSFPAGVDEDGNAYPASTQTRSFEQLKTAKILSAVFMLATVGAAAVGIVGISGYVGFGIAAGIGVANLAIQKGLQVWHSTIINGTFKEIRNELEKTVPHGCVAWVGLLYKFIQEANPLWLAPNSSELSNSAPSSKMSAILRQVASAATLAITEEPRISSTTKGMNYKDHLRILDRGLNSLESRWNCWHKKHMLVAPAIAIGWGAMGGSLYFSTIVPRIP